MQFFKASVLAALVASVSALQVTSPASGAAIDVSKKNTITWTSVSTDPSTFEIQLVNEHVNPSVTITIASSVDTSADSYTFGPLSGVTSGEDYQINLISTDAENTGILAQSGQFTITSAGSSSTTSVSFSSSTPSTSGTSTSASSTTSSMTTTTTGSSSGSATSGSASSTSSSSSSTGSSSGSSTASSSSASASSTSSSSNAAAGVHVASGMAGLGLVAMVAALFA